MWPSHFLLELLEDLWFLPLQAVKSYTPLPIMKVASSVIDINIQNGLLVLLCYIRTGIFQSNIASNKVNFTDEH